MFQDKTFMAGCYDVLVHSPSSTELTRSELGVFKLFNFLALVMIGAVAKSESKLTHFLKHELRKDIANLINTPQAYKYAPPCSECIKQVSTSIVKNTPVVSSFIAKCVDYYWVSAEIPTNVTAIMGATFLADTEWKGMGILSMIVEITGHYYLPWKTLVKLTANNKNLQTWKTVINFMRQYQNIDNEDKTVRWARMLDDAYFSELSIKRNHLLASLLAETLITIQGHRGLYNAKWARQYQKTLEEYRRASEYLRDMIIKLSRENYYI